MDQIAIANIVLAFSYSLVVLFIRDLSRSVGFVLRSQRSHPGWQVWHIAIIPLILHTELHVPLEGLEPKRFLERDKPRRSVALCIVQKEGTL